MIKFIGHISYIRHHISYNIHRISYFKYYISSPLMRKADEGSDNFPLMRKADEGTFSHIFDISKLVSNHFSSLISRISYFMYRLRS